MQTIIYFTQGISVTAEDAIAINAIKDEIRQKFKLIVVNSKADLNYGSLLNADFVAGSIPDEYSEVAEWSESAEAGEGILTIVYFTDGIVPTLSERNEIQAIIDFIALQYQLKILNGAANYQYGAGQIHADFVAGSIPASYSEVPEWSGGGSPGTWDSQFNFNNGDTTEDTINGVFFQSIQSIGTPAGETESGLQFTYPQTTPDLDPPNSEVRLTHPQSLETWDKIRVYIPANFFHRVCTGITVSGDLTNWVIGDTVTGVDGTSTGEIWYKNADVIYLNFADNPFSNEVWVGTITNTTKSETRTSTNRSIEANNNKLFAKWCDDYSAQGFGPTIVWEFSADNTGGSQLGQQYSAGQQTVTGAHGREQIYAQNFINYPEDLDTWIDLIFHVKMSSARGVRDGVIEMYIKRAGDENYSLFITQSEADIGPAVEAVEFTELAQAYFIGYSNSGYDEETSIFVSEYWHSTVMPEELEGIV